MTNTLSNKADHQHDWRYTGYDRGGTHKGEDHYTCKCGAWKYELDGTITSLVEPAQSCSTLPNKDTQEVDPETKAWAWLTRMVGAICDEAPEDIAYTADQMVGAFMAGQGRTTQCSGDTQGLAGFHELLGKFGLLLTDDPDFDHDDASFGKAQHALIAALRSTHSLREARKGFASICADRNFTSAKCRAEYEIRRIDSHLGEMK